MSEFEEGLATGLLLGDGGGGGTTVLNGLCQKIVNESHTIGDIFNDGTYKITMVATKDLASELHTQNSGIQSVFMKSPSSGDNYMSATAFVTIIYYMFICKKNDIPICVCAGHRMLMVNGPSSRYLETTTYNGVTYFYDRIYYTVDWNNDPIHLIVTDVEFPKTGNTWIGQLNFTITGTIDVIHHSNRLDSTGKPIIYTVETRQMSPAYDSFSPSSGREFSMFLTGRVIPNYDLQTDTAMEIGNLIKAVNIDKGYFTRYDPTRYISETGQILDHIPTY
jgi:hypothetical protein